MTSDLQMAKTPKLKHIGSKLHWVFLHKSCILFYQASSKKKSVGRLSECAFLVNQYELADNKPVFGRLSIRRNNENFMVWASWIAWMDVLRPTVQVLTRPSAVSSILVTKSPSLQAWGRAAGKLYGGKGSGSVTQWP